VLNEFLKRLHFDNTHLGPLGAVTPDTVRMRLVKPPASEAPTTRPPQAGRATPALRKEQPADATQEIPPLQQGAEPKHPHNAA
jgi:hypothetical protein